MEQINLNLIPNGILAVCHVSQYDNTGRKIRFHLFNGSDTYALSGTETITLRIRKTNGEILIFDIPNTASDYIDLTVLQQMTDVSGDSVCEFRLTDSGLDIGSFNFKMKIEPDAFDGNLSISEVSGNIVTFKTDLAEDLIKLDVDLEPIQDLHGYDGAWSAGGGKNLLNMTAESAYDGQRYTATGVEGNITLESIEAFGRVSYVIEGLTIGESYTFSANIAHPVASGKNCTIYLNNAIGWASPSYGGVAVGTTPSESRQFTKTIVATSTTLFVGFYITAGSAYGDVLIVKNAQVEKGSTATSWTPYENICPITGHDSAQLFRTGKNLLDTRQESIPQYAGGSGIYANVTYTPNNDGSITINGTSTGASVLFFNPVTLNPVTSYPFSTWKYTNNRYTLSVTNGWGLVTGDAYIQATVKKIKDDSIVSRQRLTASVLTRSFTVREDEYIADAFVRLSSGASAQNINIKIQLELGSEMTDYEPYSSDPTPITVQFGQTVYKGILYSKLRKVLVTHVGINLGDIDWTIPSGANYFLSSYLEIEPKGYPVASTSEDMCSHYKGERYTNVVNGTIPSGFTIPNTIKKIYLYDQSKIGLTAEQFKTAVNGITLVYEVEEPFYIDLSQEQTEDVEKAAVASFETNIQRPLETSEHYFSCSQAEGTPTPDSPIPITGVSSVTITRTGKNIVQASKFQPTTAAFIFGYRNEGFLLKGGVTYTFSINVAVTSLRLVSVDEATVYAQSSDGKTITYTPDDDTLVVFRLWKGEGVQATEFQLEVGSSATPYEPYNGESVTVSLGGTYYGGKLVQKEDGSRKIVLSHKKLTFDGTENWQPYPTQNGFHIVLESVISDAVKDTISDRFVSVNSYSLYGIRVQAGGERYYFCKITDNISAVTDLASWKTWLASNNVTVVSKLETPIEIDLPDGDPLTTLVGENNVYCNTGDTALTYYFNMVADPIRIPALVGTNNVYSDAGDVDVEHYTTLEGGND